MRRNIIIIATLAMSVSVILVSCNNSGSSNKSSTQNAIEKTHENVDVPLYALGQASFFGEKDYGDFRTVLGEVSANYGYLKLVSGKESPTGYQISAQNIEVNETQFLLTYSSTPSYSIKPDYMLHALLNTNGELNPYDKDKRMYSDTWYTVNNRELQSAIETFSTATKVDNQASQYNVSDFKDRGGVKTYKSKIVASVFYRGVKELKSSVFMSLYLECGSVVQLYTDDDSFKDKTIDCVTDKGNNVIEFKIENK